MTDPDDEEKPSTDPSTYPVSNASDPDEQPSPASTWRSRVGIAVVIVLVIALIAAIVILHVIGVIGPAAH
jgi:hypothetical protein